MQIYINLQLAKVKSRLMVHGLKEFMRCIQETMSPEQMSEDHNWMVS